MYTFSTSPGVTAIIVLIMPPFPPIAKAPLSELYESPPLAPYNSTMISVRPLGTVNACAAPVKVNTFGLVTSTVGELVGALVGEAVSCALGPTVGTTVGGALGLEGICVGDLVGCAVGITVGLDGAAVGSLEGTIVGAQVGPVGAVVGAVLGPMFQYRIAYPSPTFIPVREEISVPFA
jgi:hypothetical protein